jgi:hypothetical protein
MQRGHTYPPDLARYVEQHWPAEHTLPVSSALFAEALAVAFQASMTQEEGRATRFRLLITPHDRLPEDGVPNDGVLRLRFDRSRPLHEDELRRLSPSTPFETALIGAHAEDDKLRIWGIAHSGPAWLAPTWGGRRTVSTWTYDPIVHVTDPGHIAVRCAGELIGGLERGVLVEAVLDVFESTWLPQLFAREREAAQAERAARRIEAPTAATAIERALVRRISQDMLRRVIQLVRSARHGGMILIVDTSNIGGRNPLDSLRLKYRVQRDEPSRRFASILTRMSDAAVSAPASMAPGASRFTLRGSAPLEHLEQDIFELSRLIANLTSIDGAVVLDKRFGLLGYGAEVSAELPTPDRILRALDNEGTRTEIDDLENVGTRHRAAYRFIHDHPEGLAIVVSHDGGVSFVANRNGAVVFWRQSVGP